MFVLLIFIVILLFAGGVGFLSSPRRKGKQGEQQIQTALNQLPPEYTIFNDVVLRTNNGTTQIDHLVVSPYGIFVIETKNYRGDIYGNDDQNEWKQIIKTDVNYRRSWKTYTYVTKSQFYNPVRQSKGHAACVLKMLPSISFVPVVPIVVFTGKANLSGVHSSEVVLSNSSQLISTIRSYTHTYLTESEVRRVRIECFEKNVREEVDDNTHIQYVRSNQRRVENSISNGICPRCGKALTLRNGRTGKFWGCSGYPNCKFTSEYR